MRSFWRMDEADVSYGTPYIKHYCTKSLEEFVKCKIKRAMSNNMAYNERFDINSYYYMYNERTRKKMNCISYLENNIFLNYLHLM